MAGGIRIDDPAIDLSIMASIMSSYQSQPIHVSTAFCAEVGLSGEIRPVQRVEQRINEAEKIGFKNIVLSKYNKISDIIDAYYEVRLELYGVRKAYMIEALEKELVLLCIQYALLQ